jgi:hypothetical protein
MATFTPLLGNYRSGKTTLTTLMLDGMRKQFFIPIKPAFVFGENHFKRCQHWRERDRAVCPAVFRKPFDFGVLRHVRALQICPDRDNWKLASHEVAGTIAKMILS